MRIFVYAAYCTAAVMYAQSEPMLGVVALGLMAWLVMLVHFEEQLAPNDGPWNEPEALDISLAVLPRMTTGLSLFGPLYATLALSY